MANFAEESITSFLLLRPLLLVFNTRHRTVGCIYQVLYAARLLQEFTLEHVGQPVQTDRIHLASLTLLCLAICERLLPAEDRSQRQRITVLFWPVDSSFPGNGIFARCHFSVTSCFR